MAAQLSKAMPTGPSSTQAASRMSVSQRWRAVTMATMVARRRSAAGGYSAAPLLPAPDGCEDTLRDSSWALADSSHLADSPTWIDLENLRASCHGHAIARQAAEHAIERRGQRRQAARMVDFRDVLP